MTILAASHSYVKRHHDQYLASTVRSFQCMLCITGACVMLAAHHVHAPCVGMLVVSVAVVVVVVVW